MREMIATGNGAESVDDSATTPRKVGVRSKATEENEPSRETERRVRNSANRPANRRWRQLAILEQVLRDLDDPQVNGDGDPRFHEAVGLLTAWGVVPGPVIARVFAAILEHVPYKLLVAGGGWGKHGGLFAEAAHSVKLNKQIRREMAADDARATWAIQ